MADRTATEASTSASVQFKRGRAGKRRQRQETPGDEGDAAAIKQARPELKGAIQVSTARQAGQGLLDDAFTGTGEIQEHGDLGATRALESETLRGQDKRSIREAGMKGGEEEDGKYHGMTGYKDWRGVRVSMQLDSTEQLLCLLVLSNVPLRAATQGTLRKGRSVRHTAASPAQ